MPRRDIDKILDKYYDEYNEATAEVITGILCRLTNAQKERLLFRIAFDDVKIFIEAINKGEYE